MTLPIDVDGSVGDAENKAIDCSIPPKQSGSTASPDGHFERGACVDRSAKKPAAPQYLLQKLTRGFLGRCAGLAGGLVGGDGQTGVGPNPVRFHTWVGKDGPLGLSDKIIAPVR